MAFLGVVMAAAILAAAAVEAQQSYVNNKQLDCNKSPNNTLGFVCNAAPSCASYLTFRSTPTYNNPPSIAFLLAADASAIATANNISDVAPLAPDTPLLIPINCSCSASKAFYQHNASYALKTKGETYFTVANDTYQSLSTCQSLIAHNPYDLRGLLPAMRLTVPLLCACLTAAQSAAGFNFLLTYLLRQHEDVNSVAAKFASAGADAESILAANMLTNTSTVYFFTPLLVPLKSRPTAENLISAAASSPPPPPPPTLPTTDSPSPSHKWIFIGVGIGSALLVIVLSSFALIWLFRRRRRRHRKPSPPPHHPHPHQNTNPNPIPNSEESLLSEGIRIAIETLTVYTLSDLEKATNSFAESNRMANSSVYRGWFNSDEAVVKVMKVDVSREIETLRQINHSRIVRLSGFCLHEGTTYLVYELAANGSLHERLRNHKLAGVGLDWKQRVEIAYDVADALNYLHNFTTPPYIHKNLTTANILLDAQMRAKLANFGLARALGPDDLATRHVVGAQGYMAPEYIETGLLTPKLDVFAFGVVMLELLSGREAGAEKLPDAIDEVLSGDNVRAKLRGFMDPNLNEDDYPLELAYSMAQLAKSCVAHNLDARPNVSEVLVALSALRSSSLDWDPSQDTSINFTE